MKNLIFFRTVILLIAAWAFELNAGIIDTLRGEKPTPGYQRVAFVGSAEVKEVNGTAEKLSGVDRWSPLQKGVYLQPGDMIRTQGGTVLLRMVDSGSFIKVTPQTVLRLSPLEKGWDKAVLSGSEEQQGFVVRTCRGEALAQGPDGEWQRIRVNTVLPEGTTIRTQGGAVMDLYNSHEQKAFRVSGESELRLTAGLVRATPAREPSVAAVVR
jgi:hypothetical protein